MEEEIRDEEFWARSKHGLLLTVMQAQFEKRVGRLLAHADYENMDELDRTLDAEIRKYYREEDLVDAYYSRFIETEQL